jgi:hypothetical protein
VTIHHWARTRRQKTLKDTSFETEEYNIYNPHFSSESEHRNSMMGEKEMDQLIAEG